MQLKAAAKTPPIRSAPPVYNPQEKRISANSTLAPRLTNPSAIQPQAQYELSHPIWSNGRQQIQVKVKGSPLPVGSVEVHYPQAGKAFISDLEVAQSHRRHGVATMLMKAATESAHRMGSRLTELEVRPGTGSISNQALVGMYQKLGFKTTGTSERGNPLMVRQSNPPTLQRMAANLRGSQTIQRSKKQRKIRANKIYSGQHGGMWYPSGSSSLADKAWQEHGITAHELLSGPRSDMPRTKENIEAYWAEHPSITRSQLAARLGMTTADLDLLGVCASL